MPTLNEVLDRLNGLLAEIEQLEERVRTPVFELLDGIDALHRSALERLPAVLGAAGVERLRAADPTLAWLLETYGIAEDGRAVAERALDTVRPYIVSHGGAVEVLDVTDGVVLVRLAGACSGCAASAITLREGVATALRDGLPGFERLEVAPDEGAAHPPPGPTLLQIEAVAPGGAPPREAELLQIETVGPDEASGQAPRKPLRPPAEDAPPRPVIVVEHHGA